MASKLRDYSCSFTVVLWCQRNTDGGTLMVEVVLKEWELIGDDQGVVDNENWAMLAPIQKYFMGDEERTSVWFGGGKKGGQDRRGHLVW